MERDPGSTLLCLSLPLVPLGARLTRLIGMKPWAHVVQTLCSVSTSAASGSCSSGKSKFGGGSHPLRSAVPPTVLVWAEGRETIYGWTKGLCSRSTFSESQLYCRSDGHSTYSQQIPFPSSGQLQAQSKRRD